MTPWNARRARAAWLLGMALALAGFLPVLAFACRALLPAAHAGALPELFAEPAAWAAGAEAWLHTRRIAWLTADALSGLAYALPGLAVMLAGAVLGARSRAPLQSERMRKEDARRRVQHYRGERVEPYLGTGAAAPD